MPWKTIVRWRRFRLVFSRIATERPALARLAMFCALLIGNALSLSTIAAERLTFKVQETAGIRRFGYPVSAQITLPQPISATAQFRLLHDGKPIDCQFTPISNEANEVNAVQVDFATDAMRLESKQYQLEFGDGVEAKSALSGGMQVRDENERFIVSNPPYLSWTVRKDLQGLIISGAAPKIEYFRPASQGLLVKFRDEAAQPIAAAVDQKVIAKGPWCSHLWFESALQHQDHELESTVRLAFPRTKSWVEIDWSVSDPEHRIDALGMELQFELNVEPITVDIGAGSLVYSELRNGQAISLSAGIRDGSRFWDVLRGTAGKLEPFVQQSKPFSSPAEGWMHAMDKNRCIAVAVSKFAQHSNDRLEFTADGRLTIWRDFRGASGGPLRDETAKSLRAWLHVVPMPPHVTAVTSPQSMQFPLVVSTMGGG